MPTLYTATGRQGVLKQVEENNNTDQLLSLLTVGSQSDAGTHRQRSNLNVLLKTLQTVCESLVRHRVRSA